MSILIFIGNDNLITVDGVEDESTGLFINTATVTMTLQDSTPADVAGQVFPAALTYVAASDGTYQGTLEDTLSLTTSEQYTLIVDIDAGAGLIAHFEIPTRALTRGFC